jgi:hypothetical protein
MYPGYVPRQNRPPEGQQCITSIHGHKMSAGPNRTQASISSHLAQYSRGGSVQFVAVTPATVVPPRNRF